MAQAFEQRERERQLAEETLQTRDNMIRELPLLPAAVCVCDQSGAVELYNRTAVELWGWEPPDHTAAGAFAARTCSFTRMERQCPTASPRLRGAAHGNAGAKPGLVIGDPMAAACRCWPM